MNYQRIFIYGLQSSGASLFAYFLSQITNSIAIIDLYIQRIAPYIDSQNTVILKATLSDYISLEEHLSSFKPSLKILFIRNPLYNYLSLNEKSYRNHGGLAEKKVKKIDMLFEEREERFDLTIHYEDFIGNPDNIINQLKGLNIILPLNATKFLRTVNEVIEYNKSNCSWCKSEFEIQWGSGNIHTGNLEKLKTCSNKIPYSKVIDKVKKLSPNTSKFYKL